jgi:type IV pilus assembly protein PilQ
VTDVHERVKRVEATIAKLDVETAKETFAIKFAEADDIESMLESILPEASLVTMDERTRQVSVDTIPERLDEAREFVEKWDKKLPQVSIEAYILTASTKRVRELGIDWQYIDDIGDKPLVFQRGTVAEALSLSQGVFIGEAASRLSAVIQLLATDADAEILANPRVLVNDGEVATFQNVTREPYQEGGYGSGYGGGVGGEETTPFYSRYVIPMRVNFVDVGTTLDVTPRINEDGWVEMEIQAEDSSAEMRTIKSGSLDTTVPVKTLNSVTTKVLVKSGDTIVIGGLRVDSASKEIDKIPFFGDIPFIGHAFKSTKRDADDRELLVFIRPEIVEEPDAAEREVLSEFYQSLRGYVLEAEKQPFDLGGKQKPFIQRHGVDEEGRVLPFVPKYR